VDKDGILSYTLAARSLDGSGPQGRGATLAAPPARPRLKSGHADFPVSFTLKNTGSAAAAPFDADVYRLSASVEGHGWTARLPNGLAAVKAGGTQTVTVYVSCDDAKTAKTATVTLRATSESDPARSATVTARVSRG
jgi:hypothetical protein